MIAWMTTWTIPSTESLAEVKCEVCVNQTDMNQFRDPDNRCTMTCYDYLSCINSDGNRWTSSITTVYKHFSSHRKLDFHDLNCKLV